MKTVTLQISDETLLVKGYYQKGDDGSNTTQPTDSDFQVESIKAIGSDKELINIICELDDTETRILEKIENKVVQVIES